MDLRCTICNQQDETICHILWHCPLALNAWASVRGRLQKSSSNAVEFFALATQMMDKLSRVELEVWVMISWSLWNARNRFHFDHLQSHPDMIVQSATSLLEEYQRLAGTLPPG